MNRYIHRILFFFKSGGFRHKQQQESGGETQHINNDDDFKTPAILKRDFQTTSSNSKEMHSDTLSRKEEVPKAESDRRKDPVPRTVNTLLPEHTADAAELERRQYGEAQPQVVPMDMIETKSSRQRKGKGEALESATK